jgi:hypothetical protein
LSANILVSLSTFTKLKKKGGKNNERKKIMTKNFFIEILKNEKNCKNKKMRMKIIDRFINIKEKNKNTEKEKER